MVHIPLTLTNEVIIVVMIAILLTAIFWFVRSRMKR
jgi:hypothetical protein